MWHGMDDTRRAVLSRLDAVDRVAVQADPSTLLPLARTELRRLTDGWRRLLTTHSAAPEGHCEGCRPGIRSRRWPCQVWRAAHDQLIGDGEQHRHRLRPLRNPFTRPSTP